jgi:ABC-type lipoprotein export system ATPase subunit
VVTDPTILVADEPTGDLDRVSAEDVLNLMARLNREFGKTIITADERPKLGGEEVERMGIKGPNRYCLSSCLRAFV